MEQIGQSVRRLLEKLERTAKARNEAPGRLKDRDEFWESRSRSGDRPERRWSLVASPAARAQVAANDNGRAHHGRHPCVCHGE